ncbi:MAG TPA: S8 family peptidase, partial [Thermomicrobiales bacterium]|nr:S8 family peptidase [Thermomicrobiales bacterium]
QGAVVAVVDTGVDLTHPDLVSSIWDNAGEIPGNGVDDDHDGYVDDVHGWDFASNDNDPSDGNGHGTHVAGTIAADNNGVGSTGVAPDATIMPVRVLDNNGSGSAANVAAGIRYAVQHGANIINLSLGGGYSSQILAAIQYAEQSNVLVVAAAGNESAATPGYPAVFSSTLANVLSVGAYAAGNAIASFSNHVGGSGAVQVDAPGVGIYSTYMGDGYARLSGTSMATPHVAGLAALALSANHHLTASQLRALIVDGANISVSGSDSHGGVNAALTVALAAAGQVSGSSASTAAASSTAGQVASIRRFVFSSFADSNTTPAFFSIPSPTVASADASLPPQALPPARDSAPPQVARALALVAMSDDDGAIEVAGIHRGADGDGTIEALVRERLFAAHAGEDAALWLLS